MPQMMKLEKYGETNEGRDLLLAISFHTGEYGKA